MRSKKLIKTAVFSVCLALGLFLLRQFIFMSVIVKDHSVDPTSADGERVITLRNAEINRLDIVALLAPDKPDKDCIKRVIGSSGDAIAYKDDTSYINGKEVGKPYSGKFKKALTDDQPLTGGFSLKEKVLADSHFVLGDNRRNSEDGRVIGFIHERDILGEVRFMT